MLDQRSLRGPREMQYHRWLARGLRLVRRDRPALLHIINAQLRLRRAARLPLGVRLNGRARVAGKGRLELGEGVSLRGVITPIEFDTKQQGLISVGDHTFINYGTSITAYESVVIGRGCHIGHYTFIFDNDEHDVIHKYITPPSKPVVIEDNVWLGTRVIVHKGVHIGRNSVVGAGSVVTRDVPPDVVVAGVPARMLYSLPVTDRGVR